MKAPARSPLKASVVLASVKNATTTMTTKMWERNRKGRWKRRRIVFMYAPRARVKCVIIVFLLRARLKSEEELALVNRCAKEVKIQNFLRAN